MTFNNQTTSKHVNLDTVINSPSYTSLPVSAAEGAVHYAHGCLHVYDGSVWNQLYIHNYLTMSNKTEMILSLLSSIADTENDLNIESTHGSIDIIATKLNELAKEYEMVKEALDQLQAAVKLHTGIEKENDT